MSGNRNSVGPAETTPLTLEESARRLGHLGWTQARLFEILGQRATVIAATAPQMGLELDQVAQHCGFHAALLRERLPEVRDLTPDALMCSPDAATSELLDSLAATAESVEFMAGLTRVVWPRLVVALSDHRRRCTPVADRAVMHTLGIVITDVVADWAALEAGTQSLLVDPVDVDRAGAQQVRLELLALASGVW